MRVYPQVFREPRLATESDARTELNERHDLSVVCGLNKSLILQLIERSQEPPVVEFCPSDATRRFTNPEAVRDWQARGRLSYALLALTDEGEEQLVGFGWLGPGVPGADEPQIPGARIAFAVRLYEGARGRGLALPFMQAMLDDHGYESATDNKGIWLATWNDNARAISTYEKAGFKHVAAAEAIRHGEPHTRLYMTLGDLVTN